jgi:hypothetical protein
MQSYLDGYKAGDPLIEDLEPDPAAADDHAYLT